MLPVETIAPDFNLFSTTGKNESLYDYRGKKILLVFYPADWSPVCGDELALYNEMQNIFDSYNTQVLAISVDGRWCHASYSENRNIGFPLLADFEPKGAISTLYEVYDTQEGTSKRGLYLLDEKGLIKWNYLSPIDRNPGADGILAALEELNQK
ncbi:redoxin domain-containing protein [Flavitalea sp.]|nr:redoxin domain-containing protein [Flavitalea sp.]